MYCISSCSFKAIVLCQVSELIQTSKLQKGTPMTRTNVPASAAVENIEPNAEDIPAARALAAALDLYDNKQDGPHRALALQLVEELIGCLGDTNLADLDIALGRTRGTDTSERHHDKSLVDR